VNHVKAASLPETPHLPKSCDITPTKDYWLIGAGGEPGAIEFAESGGPEGTPIVEVASSAAFDVLGVQGFGLCKFLS